MPFLKELQKYRSVAVIGMEKNCGKTVCLNYILNGLSRQHLRVCVTSIGLDGEREDLVTGTAKPEIHLSSGMYFSTSEYHYRARHLTSEIVDISDRTTATGRLVTARVLHPGSVILSGPSTSPALRRWMDGTSCKDADLYLIDGALSRKSSASPAVSQAMVLATGAALSCNPGTLIERTAFCIEMIQLPVAPDAALLPEDERQCISSMDTALQIHPGTRRLDVSGALTDRLLTRITSDTALKECEVVVLDFTRIFITPMVYQRFVRGGGKLSVALKAKLLAVCVNPVAPNGYRFDSERLCGLLSQRIQMPVYDIMKQAV